MLCIVLYLVFSSIQSGKLTVGITNAFNNRILELGTKSCNLKCCEQINIVFFHVILSGSTWCGQIKCNHCRNIIELFGIESKLSSSSFEANDTCRWNEIFDSLFISLPIFLQFLIYHDIVNI